MTPELVTSILSFLLNSAVLSSFIIPQAQKLKEIKDQLFKFKLPPEQMAAWMPTPTRESSRLEPNAVDRLQSLLDVYDARFRELQPFRWYFLASILVVLVTLVVAAWLPVWTEAALSINPAIQLLILWLAVRTYTVDPGRLSSAPFLVQHCDINPHLLAEALKLGVHIRTSTLTDGPTPRDEPLSIQLTFRLRVSGFRFVLIVSDQKQRPCFLSFGPMTPRTHYFRHLLDRGFEFMEMNELEIGRCRFNAIPGGGSRVSLLVFMPVFPNEMIFPMIGCVDIDAGMDRKEVLAGHSGMAALRPDRIYKGVRYSGLGSKLRAFDISSNVEDREEPIGSVLERYKHEIVSARSIRQYEDLTGGL